MPCFPAQCERRSSSVRGNEEGATNGGRIRAILEVGLEREGCKVSRLLPRSFRAGCLGRARVFYRATNASFAGGKSKWALLEDKGRRGWLEGLLRIFG